MHELEGGALVTYASSFSKTVAPGVRVGWFVAPADLASRLEARAVSNYISPPFLTQATVHELIDRGAFEPNLARVKGLLRQRRDAMLAALERHLGAGASWSEPEGGYFLWVDLPVDAGELLTRAEAAGVTFVKGADFYPASGREAAPSGVLARSESASADSDLAQKNSARLAFSYASPSEIGEGVSILASLLR